MLFNYWQQCGGVCCLAAAGIWVMSAFTHFYNEGLPAGHEEKKTYHPYAWVSAPFTLPLWALVAILSAILYTVFFGLLLAVFALALVAIRKPFLIKWLKETALKVGGFFLKINTRLLRWAWPLPAPASA
jgi:hypothetical protein